MDIDLVYSKRKEDDLWQKQTKVISTKVSVDQHNRFNILAEYLYENGLTESSTPSALLRANIDDLLLKYHDKLEEYCTNSTVNRSLPIPIPQPPSSLSSQEPKQQSESDKIENYVGELILEGIQSKYNKNNKNYYDMDKGLEIQERTEITQMLPSISSELEVKIDELANSVMHIIDQFDKGNHELSLISITYLNLLSNSGNFCQNVTYNLRSWICDSGIVYIWERKPNDEIF